MTVHPRSNGTDCTFKTGSEQNGEDIMSKLVANNLLAYKDNAYAHAYGIRMG